MYALKYRHLHLIRNDKVEPFSLMLLALFFSNLKLYLKRQVMLEIDLEEKIMHTSVINLSLLKLCR